MCICTRLPCCATGTLQVIAIIGERSSSAQPTPVARFVAPGPCVAMARPGLPVIRPVTSAANPAEPSCAINTKRMPAARIASINGSTLPLGMPNPSVIPAFASIPTMRSALVAMTDDAKLALHDAQGECMELGLAGRRVLVTGGSLGIGFSVAKGFLAEGCHVTIAARDEARLTSAVEHLSVAAPGRIGAHAIDLSQQGAPEALAEAHADTDILVNNAGAIPTGD